jgi:hypothetical protein
MQPIGNFLKKVQLRPYTPEQLKASEEYLAWKNAALMDCFSPLHACGEGPGVRPGGAQTRSCMEMLVNGRSSRKGAKDAKMQRFFKSFSLRVLCAFA